MVKCNQWTQYLVAPQHSWVIMTLFTTEHHRVSAVLGLLQREKVKSRIYLRLEFSKNMGVNYSSHHGCDKWFVCVCSKKLHRSILWRLLDTAVGPWKFQHSASPLLSGGTGRPFMKSATLSGQTCPFAVKIRELLGSRLPNSIARASYEGNY